MPRPDARVGLDDAWRTERPVRSVEGIHEQLVESEVGDDSEAIVGRHRDGVRVRPLLTFRIHAGALVADERGEVANFSVGQ